VEVETLPKENLVALLAWVMHINMTIGVEETTFSETTIMVMTTTLGMAGISRDGKKFEVEVFSSVLGTMGPV
jgi:hypothetical protein